MASSLELKQYLKHFPEVCTAKAGRTYNFKKLERDFEPLRSGQRWLAARDVMKIFDPELTPFGRYWQPPNEKELDVVLKARRLHLGPIAGDASALIRELFVIFRGMATPSILLRFTHPALFAVISSPVIYLLQVQQANTVDLYREYCSELEQWRHHFDLPTVAETDMALWTFYEMTEGTARAAESDVALKKFHSDMWIQRRRLARVVRPFLKRHGPLEFARILADEDPNLAGKIAGEEYERILGEVAAALYPKLQRSEGWARIVIDHLGRDGHLQPEQSVALRQVWDVRNISVHAFSRPTWEQVDTMIDLIETVCLPLQRETMAKKKKMTTGTTR